MDLITAPAPGFTDFSDAATAAPPIPVACGGDVLDRLEVWIKQCVASLAEAHAILLRADTDGARDFAGMCEPNLLSSACERDSSAGAVLAVAMKVVNGFLRSRGVKVEDTRAFIVRAHRMRASDSYTHSAEILAAWDSKRLRDHFDRLFPDVREASIAQLRRSVLAAFGRRPELTTTLFAAMHERSGDRDGSMAVTHEVSSVESFTNAIRYFGHLATGLAPAEIPQPVIRCFNDGQKRWQRAELFRRQNRPAPGILWLRFTAERRVEFALDPSVLSRLQAQWDTFQREKQG